MHKPESTEKRKGYSQGDSSGLVVTCDIVKLNICIILLEEKIWSFTPTYLHIGG